MLFKNRDIIVNNGQTDELKNIRRDILEILENTINSVDPYLSVSSFLDENANYFENKKINPSDFENLYLIGFGKASIGMAQAICDRFKIKKGAVITNDPNNKVKCVSVETYVGGHPIPNQSSIDATNKILEILNNCDKNDLVFTLISGGGSALLCKPRVPLSDLQYTTDVFLKSGANIKEINTIRKHLSYIKGGQLIKSIKGKTVCFIISDIIGDPLEFIASGPTYPDSTTFKEAYDILEKYNIWKELPSSTINIIESGVKGDIPETPKPGEKYFESVKNIIVANNKKACKSAEITSKNLGYYPSIISTSLSGEAKDTGRFILKKIVKNKDEKQKNIFISGGETTVTIQGKGKGGRNQEMILSCVDDLSKKKIVFASFATDGIDGKSDAAGAIADGYTLKKAQDNNLDPNIYLKNNNSYEFFKKINDLLITGPTGTNVMDIQLIILY